MLETGVRIPVTISNGRAMTWAGFAPTWPVDDLSEFKD
jgi:hypothetical protein